VLLKPCILKSNDVHDRIGNSKSSRKCRPTSTHRLSVRILKHKSRTHNVLRPINRRAEQMQHRHMARIHTHTIGLRLLFHFGHVWCTGFEDILEPIATTSLARKQYVRTSFNQFFGGAFCYSDGHLVQNKSYLYK